jgi:co-chaperonin GroES (HSP10)
MLNPNPNKEIDMKLVPLYNKLVVEIIKDEGEDVTPSGIILVEKQNPYYRGKVISVGQGHYQNAIRIPMDVKEGQIIRFLKNCGMAVEFDTAGTPTQIVMTDNDVYAVEEEE